MTPSLKTLGIDRLSVEERIQLMEAIWDDVAAAVESRDVPQSHKEMLDRRIAAHEADPRAGFSWEEVKALTRQATGESE